ncbi:hypothetical protein SUGI_0261560 [Cryptomeria japonica]|uniref:uncharacterized protein LOC131045101 n=1 Tax=Cryptomeria japonica TaxID=3369 RepID=UPI002408B94F|nr:uncharacterized protein LOC131045101 [Cryptomeria japonica]XP_057834613.1 uncharacterized protein LOC131045101 [Cryptomeria japonica]XP_057834614.1 uncharacterized protein LOC131045101 [Cryptomeria japonica]XP_057834615.1 uncharacterized protein LOC131045101 [Cryptomeria japonica]XP_057834617.1 uncharacterized protein LOC131045101 [Cryptomeria japonica]GLJ15851.1 hypothetical protein SUGI_0261560 [Cryptomeria japonica]
MEDAEDHYKILGLPSGKEGAKLGEGEIRKAYRARALVWHPDKRPDDPNAAATFQKIQTAYELLTDKTARKAFDDFLRLREERLQRQQHKVSEVSAKRRKMMDDLTRREREFEIQKQQEDKEKAEEDRAAKKLQEEIARIRALHAQRSSPAFNFATPQDSKKRPAAANLEKEKVLKATWNSLEGRGDYSVERLREIFEKFGTVEDIVVRVKNSKKKGSAIIVMGSKEQVDAATRSTCGDISNPLLVLPLLPSATNSGYDPENKQAEAVNDAALNNIVGAGYHEYEDTIIKKLQKAAEKAKSEKQAQS